MGCGNEGTDSKTSGLSNSDFDSISGLSSAERVTEIRRSILRRRFNVAQTLITEHLLVSPEDAEVLEMAGDLASQQNRGQDAVAFYEQSIDSSETPSTELLDKLGQQWMTMGHPFESVSVLQSAVEFHPGNAAIRQRLIGLQISLGLEQDAYEHLRWLVQRQQGQVNLLTILSDLTRPQTVEATCRYALDQATDDLRPHYSLARIPAYHGRWEEVVKELEPLVKAEPEFALGSALWGRALVELGRFEEVEKWALDLPEGIDKCMDYWMAVGSRAEGLGKFKEASGAFQRVLLINPNHPEALNRLSMTLTRIGENEKAEKVALRSREVNRLRTHVDSLLSWKNNSQKSTVQIARSLDRLGRVWEATAWLAAAHSMTQQMDGDLQATFQEMRSRLTAKTPWQNPELVTVTKSSLFSMDKFAWNFDDQSVESVSALSLPSNFKFTDEAEVRGLSHVCKITPAANGQSGLAIYQSGAGAVGVIDYDLDGWPDLYLTSMDGDPKGDNSSSNRMYRNLNGAFNDQTASGDLTNRGFSQGIAVGDYDADGFPDLLVANFGVNHLYRNNGDGTFSDVTEEVGLSGEAWTTSVALADFDGDGHCDLFELGYCGGDDVLTRRCVDKEINEPRSCSPLAFPAEGDRVWRSDGSGNLVDTTRLWLTDHEPGRGMGLVVGRFQASRGLDIYVANDMTANHLWLGDFSSQDFNFSEQATLRGVAFNQRSVAQASMGIAVGDADQDADIDFFVTHFSGDHNTYYEQVDSGLWADRSEAAGFVQPSQRLLAYGTQWIDLDHDGDLELLVANGDIDDFTHADRSYRQPFQIYQRTSSGRWSLADSSSLGAYFEQPHLARAVVAVDLDRDRRTDVVVTHLFEPVSLLRNHNAVSGNSIRLFLKGNRSHRDAIGSIVKYEVGGKARSQQLFSGDGYHCSAERVIVIGCGEARSIQNVRVEWPDGTEGAYGDLLVNQDYLFVQGYLEAYSYSPTDLMTQDR